MRVFGQGRGPDVRVDDQGEPKVSGLEVSGRGSVPAHGKAQQFRVKGDRPFQITDGQRQVIDSSDGPRAVRRQFHAIVGQGTIGSRRCQGKTCVQQLSPARRSITVTPMICPVLQDEKFLADVQKGRATSSAELHCWWLGQSGFLIQWEGRHLLLDPYLSDSLTEKYASTDKPHRRMTERVVAPERLDFVDVVTSSHNHTDHLDRETLLPLLAANSKMELIIPEANRDFVVERLGLPRDRPRGLEAGQSVKAAGFTIHAVPAAHNELQKDEHGRHKFLGYVVEAGPWTLYHSGDTLRYEGMVDWLKRHRIDLALLPINGNRPERRVAGNLDGPEAATLAHDIGAGVVIPCHFEMFEFNTASPDEFVKACREMGQAFKVLRAGERWSSRVSKPAG